MTPSPSSAITDFTMELMPFIYLYGRAEEALEFYTSALGGSYNIIARNAESGDTRLDPSFIGKISYATFTAPGVSFAVSDGGGPRTMEPDEGNITLSLRVSSVTKAQEIFAALADGGTVKAAFGDVPWGGKFGNVRDRYQNEWFILS